MFCRVKPAGPCRYLQIAHRVREGKKVRPQVIATLGRLDGLQASGQLDRLMRSGLRHCQAFAVLDAQAAGETHPVAVRRIGPDLAQRVVGLAIDVHGNPICCELWPGNTADAKTLVPVIERMRRRFGLRQITVVADSGGW